MMQLLMAMLLVAIMCPPAFGAAGAKDRLKSATDGPMEGFTWEKDDSAKSRLKATTDGPMEGYTWEKPSSAKSKLNEATEAPPSYGTFESDNSRCSFLTKPMVREDGGGLNTHAGGSVVCHLGRIMYCSAGYWNDRGNCDWPQERHAYWIEGSPPPGTQPNKEGGPEDPGGASKAGGSNDPQGGQGGLLGQNPREQELERERQQLQNEVQQLRQMQQSGREGQGQGAPPQQGAPPRALGIPQAGAGNRMPLTGGGNMPTCAQAREALVVIDRNMREIEAYSKATTTVPGAIHPIYKDLYNASLKDRARAEQFIRENNCP